MRTSVWKRGGISLAAVAVIAGIAGCQSGDGGTKEGASGEKKTQSQPQAATSPVDVITAAYKKTAAAKSAKVRMNMTVPGEADNTMEMTGTMGWDPMVMDITMDGSALQGEPDAPKAVRVVWIDNAMYMDLGAAAAKDMDGKRWMKFDLDAEAAGKGNGAAKGGPEMKALTGGLDDMNQDPAQQLALLLESPSLKHVGSEKVDGVQADHYKGRFTVDEMIKSNKSFDVLSPEERKKMLDGLKKAGVTSYDTEVWVNSDSYPVRMDTRMSTTEGEITASIHYSDYGVKAAVSAPPKNETVDLMEMLAGLGAE
ncbi:hypothetical protein [Streptomyces sp. NPDC088725]|uniref:hypothetical protein n=1 Tax=Streptomyces sp. NPDC088725 TaxID=3365873 RepID=UPI00380208BC